MENISPKLVLELRDRTGLSLLKCRQTLIRHKGDLGEAFQELLNEWTEKVSLDIMRKLAGGS
jgi:translation elongation factor EF-Ts